MQNITNASILYPPFEFLDGI